MVAVTNRVTLTQTRRYLGELVNLAGYGGQITAITRHGKPAVAIVPLPVFQLIVLLEETQERQRTAGERGSN